MKAFQHVWNAMQAESVLPFMLVDCAGLEAGASALPTDIFSELACLFTGELESELADVAPYLGQIASLDSGVARVVEDLLDREVAILLTSGGNVDFAFLHRHFRKFNVVYGPGGSPMFFRYYDPRVLVNVLSVMDQAQLQAFFGPVDSYFFVGNDRTVVRCHSADGVLQIS